MTAGRGLAIAGAIGALLAVGAGLWVIGSPATQRAVRLDERRLDDLDRIAESVQYRWEADDALPPDLATLAARPGSTMPTKDPDTGQAYEYVVVDAHRFRLCAVFATDTAEYGVRRRAADRDHGRGRHCFDHRVETEG